MLSLTNGLVFATCCLKDSVIGNPEAKPTALVTFLIPNRPKALWFLRSLS